MYAPPSWGLFVASETIQQRSREAAGTYGNEVGHSNLALLFARLPTLLPYAPKRNAVSEDRIHDLRIMRPTTHYQLRFHRSGDATQMMASAAA